MKILTKKIAENAKRSFQIAFLIVLKQFEILGILQPPSLPKIYCFSKVDFSTLKAYHWFLPPNYGNIDSEDDRKHKKKFPNCVFDSFTTALSMRHFVAADHCQKLLLFQARLFYLKNISLIFTTTIMKI